MKKLLMTSLVIVMVLCACSSNQSTNTSQDEEEQNSVVLYFSATGNTKKVAQSISTILECDILEIVPKEEYTDDDLNYNNDNSRANQEQSDENARPEIKDELSLESYDIIYLGYPIWWGDVPKIILTLLDTYDLSEKTVIPFCTSGGSDISQSESTLKSYNDKINWMDGKRFSSSVSNDDIETWIESLDL